jgi:ppGpp synthetase/RelA/SpoT-type nucleotidyltranferase
MVDHMDSSDYFRNEEVLLEEYNKIKDLLHAWGKFIDNHLIDLLNTSPSINKDHLEILPSYRLKSDTSLIKKAFYREAKYEGTNPLLMEDKIGTRIVVTLREEIDPIEKIIVDEQRYWIARRKRSLGQEIEKDPSSFQYDSLHLILTPTDGCDIFRTLEEEERQYYVCEVQVRTLLQHAYAQVAHDTIYKGPFSESINLVRTLSTCNALMEVVDKYFSSAIEEMRKDSEIESSFLRKLKKIGKDRFDIKYIDTEIDFPLNYDLLRLFNGTDIDLERLEATIIRENENVKILLNAFTHFLSRQPILLLIAYYVLDYQQDFLYKNWPLERDILREIVQKLGHRYRH